MADGPSDSTSEREASNNGFPQNSTSEEEQYRNISTTDSSNQQNAYFSRSQEPWNVLLYWMSAQYYQQYYYYLTSYMYYWQAIASNSMYQGAFQAQSSIPQLGVQQQGTQAGLRGQQAPNNQQNPPYGGGLLTGQAAPWGLQARQPVRTVCEVQIAPISKRIYAEILDFIFLYFTKTLVFSIFYDDLERYSQLQYTLITDDNANLKDIEELLIQALVYRLIVFAYEVFFLMGGLHGSVGGATPGKYLMGLSIVATDYIYTVGPGPEGDRVRIEPGGNLGFWRSFVRALMKNFSMTFLFPVFLTVLFFQHNRTIYDVISNATVVITTPAQPRQRQDNNR